MRSNFPPTFFTCFALLLSFLSTFQRPAEGGVFFATGQMTRARSSHLGILLQDGKVLVVSRDATADIFNPATAKWSETSPVSTNAINTATLLADGKVLVVVRDQSELYDPCSGGWTPSGGLAAGMFRSAAIQMPDGKVLLIGGEVINEGTASAATAVYDPATGGLAATR
jgi:hypothetical protein